MITKQKRPKFLNLFRIHLPVTGINSFAHRVSGFLLFLAIPLFIIGFNMSLRNPASFERLITLFHNPCIKLVMTLLSWAAAHHLLAGIRFLLTELNIGTSLAIARKIAWLVNLSGLLVFVLMAYWIWLL